MKTLWAAAQARLEAWPPDLRSLWLSIRSGLLALRHRHALLDKVVTKAESMRDGFAHHMDIWREALAADRLRPKLGPMGEAELAFLPAALEISERPASSTARMIAFTICGFFAGSIAWASIGELDIMAVAQGKIIPSVQVQQIQPTETAVVRAIHIAEGQTVKQGQPLIDLEVSGGRADMERLKADFDTARTDMARLDALLEPEPLRAFRPQDLPPHMVELARSQLAAQLAEHQGKLASLRSELARKSADLRTAESEIKGFVKAEAEAQNRFNVRHTLAGQGLNSQLDLSRAKEDLDKAQTSGMSQKSKLDEIRAAIDSLNFQRDQAKAEFRRDASTRLAESRAKASSAENELAKATQRQQVLSLTAPVDGTAQQLEVHTIGGVVQPAQKLLVIVPAGSTLEVDARLPNKDIAFIEVGQEAVVKVDAFPFTRYGTITGRITTVSLDAVQDEQKKEYYFPIRVALDRAAIGVENGKQIPLTPGMTVSAEVRTGTRRPIEYVLAPLQKYKDESGRER